MMTQKRPEKSDYAGYYEKYIALVPGGDFLGALDEQHSELMQLLSPLTDAQADFRYEPGKWSIKETIGHLSDAERIFAYRLLRIARGDQTPLASFEQDPYIETGRFSARKLSDLLDEFASIRKASVTLIRSLDDKAWTRRGTASGKEISALALSFIIAGHERHHSNILKERYLPALVRG
ncbi:MAG TPA: DinB family protein [Dongiaceae bacterium]|nr:DinB family protein [Dongiaceae bacterium]